MYDVRIPESLYQQVSEAAKAQRVSVDDFVAEAVQLRLQDESDEVSDAFFTPEIIAEIREAAAEARTGNNLTPEQCEAHFAARRDAWHAKYSS